MARPRHPSESSLSSEDELDALIQATEESDAPQFAASRSTTSTATYSSSSSATKRAMQATKHGP